MMDKMVRLELKNKEEKAPNVNIKMAKKVTLKMVNKTCSFMTLFSFEKWLLNLP
jgi:hypothetical protein